jgi:hypothetical protein
MLTVNTNSYHPFYQEAQWGQFIDIESQQLFPKQIIQYLTTEPKTQPKTPLKSILKKHISPEIYPNERETTNIKKKYNPNEGQKRQPDEEDEDDTQIKKFIEDQLYIGWLICVLTFGFCLLP